MAELTEPTARAGPSFLEALPEYHAEGRYTHLNPARLADPVQFQRYLNRIKAEATPDPLRRRIRVPQTTVWLVEGEEYLGRLSIRHVLTRSLRHLGGNIGYDVRPSRRGRGHATEMLRLSLPLAHRLGVDPALLTCDATNLASRHVIETNGGRLTTSTQNILRFWLPTS